MWLFSPVIDYHFCCLTPHSISSRNGPSPSPAHIRCIPTSSKRSIATNTSLRWYVYHNVLVQCIPLYSYANKPVYPCISSCVRINYSWISSCVSTVYPCISSCISISLYIQLCQYIFVYPVMSVYLCTCLIVMYISNVM